MRKQRNPTTIEFNIFIKLWSLSLTHSPLRTGNASFQCLYHITNQLDMTEIWTLQMCLFGTVPTIIVFTPDTLEKKSTGKKMKQKAIVNKNHMPVWSYLRGWMACYQQSNPTLIKITLACSRIYLQGWVDLPIHPPIIYLNEQASKNLHTEDRKVKQFYLLTRE